MVSIIGIDSRSFYRRTKKRNGEDGKFESVLGIAVKVENYYRFNEAYKNAIRKSFEKYGKEPNYQYYCYNDLKDNPNVYGILSEFAKQISFHITKIHVFYTLFSKIRLPEVKVYGRYARLKKFNLSKPTRTYEELLSKHLVQCFPAICAWRLSDFLSPDTVEFHLDSFEGHIFEGYERLENYNFKMLNFPSGDCSNPVIATADFLIALLDKRLEDNKKYLIFENIRPMLKEFDDRVLVYPISNKHLQFITPLDKKAIDVTENIKHPVYWVFKGEELLSGREMRRSETYRNLIDLAAAKLSVAKMFEKNKDIKYFQNGDHGVYINKKGEELIDNYIAIGKKFKKFNFNMMVIKSDEKQKHLNI